MAGIAGQPVSQERLREMLEYDPSNGAFYWKIRRAWAKAGSAAGSIGPNGYWRISINDRSISSHRLAWLYMTGEWPTVGIDHINSDKTDNAWTNLRLATPQQQQFNQRISSRNTSGLKGVSKNAKNGLWRADIMKNGKSKTIGYYDCRAAASFSYQIEADKLFGSYARPVR
jgi:hypothetical protein